MQQLIQHPNLKFIAPQLAAALIAGGSSITGSAMSFANQQMTNSRNEALAREQNQWNLAQWYRENAYNSPSEQIKRLKLAGINPGLAYSNGIENLAGQSPQMVSSQNQASARFDLGGAAAVNAYNNSRLTDSQIKLNETQGKKNLADAGLSESQIKVNDGVIELNIAKTDLTNREREHYDYLDSWYEHQSSLTLSMIDEISSKISLNQRLEFESEQRGIGQYIDNLYKNDYWQKYLYEIDQLAKKAGADASLARRQVTELVESWVIRLGKLGADFLKSNVESDVALTYSKPIAAAELRNKESEIALRTLFALVQVDKPNTNSASIKIGPMSYSVSQSGNGGLLTYIAKLATMANDPKVSDKEFSKAFDDLYKELK